MTPAEHFEKFEEYLKLFLSERYDTNDNPLSEACAYTLATPGKRVRPILVGLSAAAIDPQVESRRWFVPALAIEMIHAYSLAHDDLPAMDNDDFRRGQPSTHKKFGEDFAILAGDALLTDAFSVLGEDRGFFDTETRLLMIQTLSEAAGSRGMVLGQALDIFATSKDHFTWEYLEGIHRRKTGALLGAACAMGALCTTKNTATIEAFRRFGEAAGLAFQLRDDLLDEQEGTGKTKGKDREQGKLSCLKLKSASEVQSYLESLSREAVQSLETTAVREGFDVTHLRTFAETLLARKF